MVLTNFGSLPSNHRSIVKTPEVVKKNLSPFAIPCYLWTRSRLTKNSWVFLKPTEGSPRFQLDLRRTKMVDFCLPKFRKEPTLSLYCWSWVLFQTNNKIIVNLFYKCELNINKILQHLFMSGTNWHHRLLFSATGFNTWSISPRIKKHISKHLWINETNIWMCNIYT